MTAGEPDRQNLARRLAALPTIEMREACLLEYLSSASSEEAVEMLDQFRRLGQSGTPPYNVALSTLTSILSNEKLSYEDASELYAAAKEAGYDMLGIMFFSKEADIPTNPTGKEPTRQDLTLGHRKAMARSGDRELLERLLRDPEPAVIEILLQNAKITENDIIRLIARRPAQAKIQRLVFGAPKWSNRYTVKRALVMNPDTPAELSVRLLNFLSKTDLKVVHTSPTLSQVLRDTAAGILDERSKQLSAPDEIRQAGKTESDSP